MSSGDEEYFDAADAPSSTFNSYQWSDNEDILRRNSITRDSKNTERRNRVESLKRSLVESTNFIPPTAYNFPASTHTPSCQPLSVDPDYAFLLGFASETQLEPDRGASVCRGASVPQNLRYPTTDGSIPTCEGLSRTLPSRHYDGFAAGRLAEVASSGTIPLEATDRKYMFRSQTERPRMLPERGLEEAQHAALPTMLNSRTQQPIALLTEDGGTDYLKHNGMASAPVVSVSRLNHQNNSDYVKSWSLDATRRYAEMQYQRNLHRPNIHSIAPTEECPLSDLLEATTINLPNQVPSPSTSPDMVSSHVDCGVQVGGDSPEASAEPGSPTVAVTQQSSRSRTSPVPPYILLDSSPPAISPSIGKLLSPGAAARRTAALTLPAPVVRGDNHEKTLNPIELDYRTRTLSASSIHKSVDSSHGGLDASTGQRPGTVFSGKVRRMHSYLRDAVHAVRSATKASIFNQNDESSDEDEEVIGYQGIRLRSSRRMKGRRDFLQIKLIQEMKNEHTGAIWAMRSSPCGRLLATAGYDRSIRIWVLRQWYSCFRDTQTRAASSANATDSLPVNRAYSAGRTSTNADDEMLVDSISLASASVSTGKTDDGGSSCSSGPMREELSEFSESATGCRRRLCDTGGRTSGAAGLPGNAREQELSRRTPYRSQPLLVYRGHDGVVIDVAWSKNLFLLSTSMDRQARLWHISRRECLCVFSHNDTVPAVVFHPKDDRYFLSGSLDGKLRLWNIPDKKVRFWVEVPLPSTLPSSTRLSKNAGMFEPKTVITCATFACEGTKVAVGSYDGRVMFFNSELMYITFIAIKSASGRGHQCRVTAIEVDPTDSNKLLVTSNDSRVRLIDARDYHTLCKYRGFVNQTSQIRASFSPTARYIISGSENCLFYIWRKQVRIAATSLFSSTRKDRNNCWEAIKAHDSVVTVAIFSPNPSLLLDKRLRRWNSFKPRAGNYRLHSTQSRSDGTKRNTYFGEIVISADCNGCIRVFKNRIQPGTVSPDD